MASVKLLFTLPPVSGMPVRLVFGEEDGGPGIPPATLHGSGRLSGLRGHFTLRTVARLNSTARLSGLRGHFTASYNVNVSRPTVGQVQDRWQEAGTLQLGTLDGWQQSAPLPVAVASRWQDAERAPAAIRSGWQQTQRLQHAVHTGYEQAARLDVPPVRSDFQQGVPTPAAVRQHFQTAVRLAIGARQGFQQAYRDRYSAVRQVFQQAEQLGAGVRDDMGIAVRLQSATRSHFQVAWPPRPGRSVIVPTEPPLPDPCYLPTLPVRLLFKDRASSSLPVRLVFVCERHTTPPALVVVPTQKVYIVLNSITLHRVDTGAELRAHTFSMSLDSKSWTWSWSASLHHDAEPHLGRELNGDPAELAVSVNGWPFRLRLVSRQLDERFSPRRWAVSGQGKASILGDWRAPVLSYGNTVERTAAQLMADVLTINGVSIGWGVDFSLDDWLVPAGAWAMQGKYIEAINDIAGAAGGYVQPHPTDAVLRVLRRYPTPSWEWDTVAPDIEIPAAAAEIAGYDYVDRPAYNRVFVGGVSAGVFGPFTRSGTDGTNLAPAVTHALITDLPAWRQRAKAELSDTGQQTTVTLRMQVRPDTGIIHPGKFVRYVGKHRTVAGIVRGTSVEWNRPTLRQSLEIETHA